MPENPPVPRVLIRRSDDPEVKATTGTTYQSFSKELEALVPVGAPPPAKDKRLVDFLYRSVRLPQWEKGMTAEYKITSRYRAIRVSATPFAVTVTVVVRGSDKSAIVAEGLVAEGLYNGIAHAQAQTALAKAAAPDPNAPVWQRFGPEDTTPADEFFREEAPKGSALDPALKEEIEDRIAETQSAIADLEADIAADETDIAEFDPAAKAQSAQVNVKAAQEAQVFQQPIWVEPEQRIDVHVHQAKEYRPDHLKSLQGRILTIIDAVLSDKQQREAAKTLVNKEFRREMDRLKE